MIILFARGNAPEGCVQRRVMGAKSIFAKGPQNAMTSHSESKSHMHWTSHPWPVPGKPSRTEKGFGNVGRGLHDWALTPVGVRLLPNSLLTQQSPLGFVASGHHLKIC